MKNRENHAELRSLTSTSPVIAIVERYMLTRTCIVSILKREFSGYEICEMTTTMELDAALGTDVRLVVLDIGDKRIADPLVEDDLAILTRSFRDVPVALLSNRDEEASAAMRRGVRGFFPTSISVQVAIAGLRLVLAGGVYRPLPLDARQNGVSGPEKIHESLNPHALPSIRDVVTLERGASQGTMVELTPREKQVFAELELGLPNKMIASKLNLSENTVKMHIQHIMRKCYARNRTEAVLFCSGRLLHNNGHPRSRVSSST